MSIVPRTLEGFEMAPFVSSRGRARDVYRSGSGPAVIIVHEIPGITPLVAAFARRVAASGFTAVLPDLFGTSGKLQGHWARSTNARQMPDNTW